MFIKKNCYIFLVLILALCLSLSFSVGAEDRGKYGGTLIYAAPSVENLDFHWTTQAMEGAYEIFEGFVVADANDEIQPSLAKKWEVSEDGLTWTFYLREGVLFHNGKEMTSEDAVASARRWLEIGLYRGTLGSIINSINSIDKYTVEFKLNERFGALPIFMGERSGYLAIMPKEVCEGVPGGKLTEYIGTGPYKLVERKLDQYIKLEKFKDYKSIDLEPSGLAGRKNAYADEIIIKSIPEASTRLAALEAGEVDIIKNVPLTEIDRLRENKEINLQRYVGWAMVAFFNTKGVFQSQKLRQAAVMALDMEEILLSAGKKQENIGLAPGIFRKNSIWYTGLEEKYYNQKNTEGAKKLMQEAGYNGEEIIVLTSKTYSWAFDTAISIQDQLTKIGFNVKLDVLDWPTLVSRRGQFEGWGMYTTGFSHFNDPVMLAAQIYTGKFPGWYGLPPEILEQMKAMSQEVDFEKRYNAWSKIVDFTSQNPNWINSGFLYEFFAFRSNIKGLAEYDRPILWNVYKE